MSELPCSVRVVGKHCCTPHSRKGNKLDRRISRRKLMVNCLSFLVPAVVVAECIY